jgi:small-conductance mechanosensitive channel
MDNALNPRNLDAFASLAWAWTLDFVPRIVSAAIVLCLGLSIARWASRSSLRILVGVAHVDPTIRPMLASTVRYAILVLVLIAALGQIGVQTTSLLAVLGAAGLAVGLALSFAIGLPQSSDIERARAVLLEWIAGDPRVLKTPPPDVFVDRLDSGESSVICRLWAAPANVGALQRDWIAKAKDRLTAAGAEAFAPRRIARIVPPDSDPSRLMAPEGPE